MCWTGRRTLRAPRDAAPDLPRQLRLAQLRARLVAAAAACAAVSRTCPRPPRSRRCAIEMLVPEKVAGELAYLDRPMTGGFERPYGWAWLLALHAELALRHDRPWAAALAPLAARLRRAVRGLPAEADLSDPHRHPLQHRLRADPRAALGADARSRRSRALIDDRARDWFGEDRDCPAVGAGRRRLPVADAVRGAADARRARRRSSRPGSRPSCPIRSARRPPACSRPPIVTDRTDGKIAHLDGLNLVARLVLAPHRRRSAATRQRRGDRRRRISTPRCRIWRTIIWASIGWRRSRCWR